MGHLHVGLETSQPAPRALVPYSDAPRHAPAPDSEAGALLDALMDSLGDPVCITGWDGRYVRVNAAFQHMSGVLAPALIGRRVSEILPSGPAATIDRVGQEVLASGCPRTVECEIRIAGEARLFAITKTPWRMGSRVCGLVGIARDLTPLRKARERAEALEQELWHAARVVTLGQVATTLAHDLAQPLAAACSYITGCRTLAAQQPESRPLLRGLAGAAGAIGRAAEVVRSLRAFLRRGLPEQQPLDLNPLVCDAARLVLGASLQRWNGRVALETGPSPCVARVDQAQMQQVLINLLSNAMEAMDEVDMARRALRVSVRTCGTMAEIVVADTGPGLPASVAAAPFRPTPSRKPDRLGLGLSICHAIVNAHGGAMSVASSTGGTAFTIRLPLAGVS